MTDKQRGAASAALFCLAIIFGATAIYAAWNESGKGLAVSIFLGCWSVIAGSLTWSAET